jgi:hypothetical protein
VRPPAAPGIGGLALSDTAQLGRFAVITVAAQGAVACDHPADIVPHGAARREHAETENFDVVGMSPEGGDAHAGILPDLPPHSTVPLVGGKRAESSLCDAGLARPCGRLGILAKPDRRIALGTS